MRRKKKKHLTLRLSPEAVKSLQDLQRTFRCDTTTSAIEFAINYTDNKMLSKKKKIKFNMF